MNRVYYSTDDIFHHFDQLERESRLPTLDELRQVAKVLHSRYSSLSSYHHAIRGVRFGSAVDVPEGRPWSKPQWLIEKEAKEKEAKEKEEREKAANAKEKDKQTGKSANRARAKKKEAEPDKPPFRGDRALAQSKRFILDVILSREVSEAVASGDIGRVWEVFKVSGISDYSAIQASN